MVDNHAYRSRKYILEHIKRNFPGGWGLHPRAHQEISQEVGDDRDITSVRVCMQRQAY